MKLTEPQIQRYARQILLGEVGGKGQLALLSRPVIVAGRTEALSVAAAYLAAGGSPVSAPEGLSGFLHGASLDALAPDVPVPDAAPVWLGEWPAPPGSWAVVRLGAGVAFRGPSPDGCDDCLELAAATLGSSRGVPAVVLGSLAAMVAQKLVLGQAPAQGLLTLEHGLPRRVEPPRCPRHG